MTIEFSGRKLGVELLLELARARSDVVVTWRRASGAMRLVLRAGRPEEAAFGHGQLSAERTGVVRAVRAIACAADGPYEIEPAGAGPSGLALDTLGESLVGLLTQLEDAPLALLKNARGNVWLEPTPAYERLAAAVSKIAGRKLAPPDKAQQLGGLFAGPVSAQRAAAALFLLGGLAECAAPDNASSVPQLTAIDAAHARLGQESYYDILGVRTNATAEEIKKAYFEQAKRWHSDSFVGIDLRSRKDKVEALFQRVGEAYTTLSSAEQRKSYDFVLDRQAQGLPTDPVQILEAEGLFKRAEGMVRRGQAEGAVPILERAIELNRGEAEFFTYLGFALYLAKGPSVVAEARAHIQRSLKMRDGSDVAYEFLGRIAHAEGEIEEGVRHLRRALELNGKNRDAERELRLMTTRANRKDSGGAKSLPELLGRLFKR